MKKFVLFFSALFSFVCLPLFAEEATTAPEAAAPAITTEPVATEAVTPAVEEAPVAAPAETVEAEATPAAESADTQAAEAPPAEQPATDTLVSENLEFISGEVSSIDEAAKTVTVKLYGETEDGASDKTLAVTLDENTDITDGEKDRDLKSLTAGTEVDVEYDPSTKKATYIFVY